MQHEELFCCHSAEWVEEVKKSAKVVILDNSSSNVVGGSRKQIARPSRREEFFQDSTRFSYSDLVGKWQPYQIKGTIISVIRNIIKIKVCID